MSRFVSFLIPFGNASGSGSQLVNSYYAISNGGVFGSGLGNSVQKMGYLPEPNTDFIMSITSEELGLVGVSDIIKRSEEHTSELQSRFDLVCRLLLEKKNTCRNNYNTMILYICT